MTCFAGHDIAVIAVPRLRRSRRGPVVEPGRSPHPQRGGDRQRRIQEHRREPRFISGFHPGSARPLLAGRLRPLPAIMDSVPETPDQQTRTAVTRRIIAHVRRGWPPPWRAHRPPPRTILLRLRPAARLPRARPDPAVALPGISRPLGHRDLPGQQRPVYRVRAADFPRPQDRHPRRRGR